MTLAADLLRALSALGVTFVVDGGTFRASAPVGLMSPTLRERIGEHRAALRELLASPYWRSSCTPVDQELIEEDVQRFDRGSLSTVIGEWLAQYGATGYEPFVEVAAWFAAVREAQDNQEVPRAV